MDFDNDLTENRKGRFSFGPNCDIYKNIMDRYNKKKHSFKLVNKSLKIFEKKIYATILKY